MLLLPVGFAMLLQMSSSNTLIQSMVPDELRGRVMSVYMTVFAGTVPIGSLLKYLTTWRCHRLSILAKLVLR